MEAIKEQIINLFESKGDNFKKSLAREFKKTAPLVVTPEMNKYRQYLISEILRDLTEVDDTILYVVENPLDLVEETLFQHILSK